jgi:hypothetical protein
MARTEETERDWVLSEPAPGEPTNEQVDHPTHYGGADDPYEAIKVIEAWDLGFCLGNAVKYINRAGRKPGQPKKVDLEKARWYLDRAIQTGGK